MKRYFLFSLLILTFIASANAQKLVYGGKPKASKIEGLSDSFCVNLANQISICKGREAGEDGDGKFFVRQNGKKKGEIGAAAGVQASSDNFFAFYGDLDKNKSSELIIVDFTAQSNGLGVSYYEINVFPDFQTKGFQEPITFDTTEFGAEGTFLYDAKANETLILLTDWYGLDNISKKEGTYFVGRFFRYKNGMLKPATDKPVYARRYLYSFESERYRTEKNPLRPWIWLNSPKAQKLQNDPEFSLKPASAETGVVEKYERIKEVVQDETGKETDSFYTDQIVVKFGQNETKTIVLSSSSDFPAQTDNRKIYPEIVGILPAQVSLPRDLNAKLVLGNLEGKKVLLNSYKSGEEGNIKYKILFYE